MDEYKKLSEYPSLTVPELDGTLHLVTLNGATLSNSKLPINNVFYDGLDSGSIFMGLTARQGKLLNESKANLIGANVFSGNQSIEGSLFVTDRIQTAGDIYIRQSKYLAVLTDENTPYGVVQAKYLPFLNGVTSSIQAQLDSKLSAVSPSFTGDMTLGPVGGGFIHNGVKTDYSKLRFLNNITSDLNSLLSSKASISYVNSKDDILTAKDSDLQNQINALSNGAPAGVYSDLNALILDNPNHAYIYLTLDDGKWNYWDGMTFSPGWLYQTPLETESVRSQSFIAVPQSKLLDDELSVIEDKLTYKAFTDKEVGNKFIKEVYLSGEGLNLDKIYYLDLVTRQSSEFGNGLFIKESDPGFLNDTVIISVLNQTEESLSGIISASNIAGTINIKLIVNWEVFPTDYNSGETLKCVFNDLAFNPKNSPYIYAKENVDDLNETINNYILNNGNVTYADPEFGDNIYSSPAVTALGVYRQMPSTGLVNEITFYGAAPSDGYTMQIRVYKSSTAPMFSNVPDVSFMPIYSGVAAWDSDPNTLKKVKIPSTLFNIGEYVIVMFATFAALAPSLRQYAAATAGKDGFIYSTSSNYSNVFSEQIAVAEEGSAFSQAMPGIYHVSDSASVQELQDAVDALEVDKSDKITPRITIPSVVYAVVGTELNLYYDAITIGSEGGLRVEVLSDIGVTYERMYQLNPVVGDVGDHDVVIKVYDVNRSLLETKELVIRVINNTAPSTVKNILMVGDSTLNNGPLTPTLRDNFVALGSNTPAFWGGKGVAPARHQGWPGASAMTYATAAVGDSRYEFTVSGATGLEQDAFYSNNGSVFVVQDIYTTAGVGKIRAYKLSGVNEPSSSGTLTKTDGVGPALIAFSTVTAVSANPLWNTATNQLSVSNYRSNLNMGSTKFDVVAIRLGVNESFGDLKDEADRLQVINYLKTIISAFVSDSPLTKFIIELPTTDSSTKSGWGVNYGAAGKRETYQLNVWRLRELMLTHFDNGAYSVNVEVCPTGCMVDRYYGYELLDVPVASRIATTEKRHNNAVHPTTGGYYQLADAVFPHILKLIQ